jgi:hypothetical protein
MWRRLPGQRIEFRIDPKFRGELCGLECQTLARAKKVCGSVEVKRRRLTLVQQGTVVRDRCALVPNVSNWRYDARRIGAGPSVGA